MRHHLRDTLLLQVEVENVNREDSGVSASGVDAAIAVLSVSESPADRHPEKRAKAAWEVGGAGRARGLEWVGR